MAAQQCEICGRGRFGNRVSHAHNVTHRNSPNLQ